jgi:hypothetical protein
MDDDDYSMGPLLVQSFGSAGDLAGKPCVSSFCLVLD